MKNEEKINARQMAILTICFIIGRAILLVPSILTRSAANDAWISALLGTIIGMFVVMLLIKMMSREPELSVVQHSVKHLGKWFGGFIAINFILFCLMVASMHARSMGDFMTTQALTETPIEAINIIFILTGVIATRLGIEVIARASEIFFPYIVLMLMILFLFLIPELEIDRIQPILGNGLKPVMQGAYANVGFPFFEVIVLMMVIQFVNRPKAGYKGLMTGTAIGGLFIAVLTLVSVLALGAETVAIQLYPTYMLAKIIDVGDVFQRIEPIVAGIWFLSLFFKMTLSFFAAALGISHLLQLEDYRFLVWPLGLIICILSIIIYPHIVYVMDFTEKYWTLYTGSFSLLIPLLLLCVTWIKERTNRQRV